MKLRGTALLGCHDCGHEWENTGVMEDNATVGGDALFWADGESKCPECETAHWGWMRFEPMEAANLPKAREEQG